MRQPIITDYVFDTVQYAKWRDRLTEVVNSLGPAHFVSTHDLTVNTLGVPPTSENWRRLRTFMEGLGCKRCSYRARGIVSRGWELSEPSPIRGIKFTPTSNEPLHWWEHEPLAQRSQRSAPALVLDPNVETAIDNVDVDEITSVDLYAYLGLDIQDHNVRIPLGTLMRERGWKSVKLYENGAIRAGWRRDAPFVVGDIK